jgi:hypothetical protein
VRLAGETGVADGIDVVMNVVQASEVELASDLPVREAQLVDLIAGDHPQLAGRDPGQPRLTRMTILTTMVHIVIRVGHWPTVAGESLRMGDV